MKKLILLLIICFQMMGQNRSKEELQKNRFDLGQSFLKQGKNVKAIQLFHFAHHIIPNNELGRIAFKKYDSLKPTIREKLRKDLIGNWKKIYDGPSWVTPDENGLIGEMISVNKNEILFFELYKNTKEWCLVRTEPINFCKKTEIEKQYTSFDATFTEFTYKNNEVWQYYRDENSGLLKTYNVGYELENGVSEIICGGTSSEYFKLE